MNNSTRLIDVVQAEWPLLPSLALTGIGQTLPEWALASAQRAIGQIQPAQLLACRAQIARQAQVLALLHRRWVVAAALAVLLALAVVAAAGSVPLDAQRTAVLAGVLAAILLPPLAICNGIARDYVAAQALIVALGCVMRPATSASDV